MFMTYVIPAMIVILWLCVGIMGVERFIEEGGDSVGWAKMPYALKLLMVVIGPVLMVFFEYGYIFRNEDEDKSTKV